MKRLALVLILLVTMGSLAQSEVINCFAPVTETHDLYLWLVKQTDSSRLAAIKEGVAKGDIVVLPPGTYCHVVSERKTRSSMVLVRVLAKGLKEAMWTDKINLTEDK